MSYVAIWLQACLHWRCAYFQTLSWNDTIFVVDWDILYKLCGSENKWSKGFIFSGKIWWQLFSCNKACSKYHTRRTTAPKYTLPQRLVIQVQTKHKNNILWCFYRSKISHSIICTQFPLQCKHSVHNKSQNNWLVTAALFFSSPRLTLRTKFCVLLAWLIKRLLCRPFV